MMKAKGASGFLNQVVSLVMSVVKAKSMAVKSKTSAFKTRLIVFGLLRNKKVLMTAVSHKIHALLGAGHDDHHQHDDNEQLHRSGSGAGSAAAADGDDSKAVVLYSAVPNEEEEAAAAGDDDDDPEAAASAETSALINNSARSIHFGIIPHHGDHSGMNESTDTANLVNNINGDDVEAAAAKEEEEEEEDEDDDGYPDLRHSLFDEEEEWYLRGDDGTGSVVDLVRNMIRGEEEDGREFVLEDEIDQVADVFIRRFHRQMRMQKLDSFKRFQEMMERSV